MFFWVFLDQQNLWSSFFRNNEMGEIMSFWNSKIDGTIRRLHETQFSSFGLLINLAIVIHVREKNSLLVTIFSKLWRRYIIVTFGYGD